MKKALGFYAATPASRRRRAENRLIARLSRLAYRATNRLDDRLGWNHRLADELRAVADELDDLGHEVVLHELHEVAA